MNEQKFIEAFNKYLIARNKRLAKNDPLINRVDDVSSPLIDRLIYGYDLSSVKVFSKLLFLKEKVEFDDGKYVAFGEFNDYNLTYVVDSESGEVLTYDKDFGESEFSCSKDLDTFLLCISAVLDVFIRNMENPNSVAEVEKERVGRKCIELSGGDKYEKFYKLIIGYGFDGDMEV